MLPVSGEDPIPAEPTHMSDPCPVVAVREIMDVSVDNPKPSQPDAGADSSARRTELAVSMDQERR